LTARPTKPEAPVPPHSPLREYYGKDEARASYVRELFDRAAPHYEKINRMMSLGTGLAYRRRALEQAGLRPGMRLLDIATGTGLVLRPAARIVGPTGLAVGLDQSLGMLREARSIQPLPLVHARGETLPFANEQFDFVSLGYGLRHVSDLSVLFGECFRVLRQGGRLLVLEFSPPRPGLTIGRFYLKWLVPLLTRLGIGDPGASKVMRYCWDTVDHFVPTEVVLENVQRAGFADAAHKGVFGVLAEFSATRGATRPEAGALLRPEDARERKRHQFRQ
jgi:demethylmenaquinone methyltransferase/2-methoxy-6-polyprenyl-1,4-benzoquinol methylase